MIIDYSPYEKKRSFDFKDNNISLLVLLMGIKVVLSHGLRHFKMTDTVIYEILYAFPTVPIFFIISGYLVTASYLRKDNFLEYAKSRALRLYPALFLSLMLSIVLVFCFYDLTFNLKQFAIWIFAQSTIAQFYNPEMFRGYGTGVMNGALWSVPVQMQFYLLLPFLLWLRKCENYLTLLSFILLMMINDLTYDLFMNNRDMIVKMLHVTILPHLFLFLIGVFFYFNQHIIEKYLKGRFLLMCALYGVAVLVFKGFGLRYQGASFNPLLALFLSCVVMSFAYSFTDKLPKLASKFEVSYGLYVFHMPIMNVFLHTRYFSPETSIALTVVITFIVAYVSKNYLEKRVVAL